MISDRPYLRGDYRRETTPVTTWLICAIAAAFLIQFAVDFLPGGSAGRLEHDYALSGTGLASGRVWTLATFWLVHSTGNLLHVGTVLAGVFLLGRELVGILGARRFLATFGASLLAGALVWTSVNWNSDIRLIGATAGVYGLLAVFALLYPGREVAFLVLFAFPVTFRPKHLATALLLTDTAALVWIDILARPLPFAYAPSAHLGGMLAGWLYYQFFHETEWRMRRSLPVTGRRPALVRPQEDPPECEPSHRIPADPKSPVALRAEVDRILDKINSDGLGALTPDERHVLDAAREILNRR